METSDRQERIDRMVREGIGKVAKVECGGGAFAVDWQPGDGFRYVVIITTLPEQILEFVGGTDAHVFASWADGSRIQSRAFVDGGTHVIGYVAEKFGLDRDGSTACFLTALLNMLAGSFDYGHGVYAAGKDRWV